MSVVKALKNKWRWFWIGSAGAVIFAVILPAIRNIRDAQQRLEIT